MRKIVSVSRRDMLNTLLGTKKKMSQTFVEGTRVPVTWMKVGPCIVTQIKKEETDGYWAVQLGYGEKRIKKVTKPLRGHLKGAINKSKLAPRFLREVRLDREPNFKVGDEVRASDVFKKGDVVAVTGISKGKGFAGVVKRWGFAGGPKTHGQSDRLRAPGSIGQGTTPGRVHKGKKMPGRMGTQKVTVKNLRVVDVDSEEDKLAISGSVPGAYSSLLIVKKIASGKLEELAKDVPKAQLKAKYVVKQHEKAAMAAEKAEEKGEAGPPDEQREKKEEKGDKETKGGKE